MGILLAMPLVMPLVMPLAMLLGMPLEMPLGIQLAMPWAMPALVAVTCRLARPATASTVSANAPSAEWFASRMPTTTPTPSATPITQDGYGLINAGVIWKFSDAWTFSLQGSNLADEEYLTTGYNLLAALGVFTGFYGPPRQYTLTARYDF